VSWAWNTINAWQWALILAVPPAILLLYFLKLKRQPLEIPSTFLWHRTIEDLHVNSIWQRLRQNLLLFLQLLLVLLAILSLLRPSWKGTKLTGERFIFLVDTSASMSATDVPPTRLEAVKNQLLELVQTGLAPGSVVMIISFSDRAIVEQPFTDNQRLLEAKIKAIQQTARPSMLDEALKVAAGLANPQRSGIEEEGDVAAADARPATMMVFSDGRFRTIPRFAMGNLQPEYHPIGSSKAKNIGISAFSATTSPGSGDTIQVFATIQSFCDFDTEVTANLYLADKLIDASKVQLPAESSTGIEFQIAAVERGQLRLDIAESDDLEADNTAYAAINAARRAKLLLVTPGNNSLETALSTAFAARMAEIKVANISVLKSETYKREAATGEYDLIIYDQCAPEAMPQAHTFFLGTIPPGGDWKQDSLQQLPQIIDADYAHPLLQFMNLGNVSIVDCRPLDPPQGGTILIDSQYGPLLAIAPRDGFEDLVLAFQIVGASDDGSRVANTNWHIRPSFPVFIGNLIAHLGGASTGENESRFVEPGQSIALRTRETVSEIRVESPTGQQLRISRGQKNAFVYGNTDRKGIYKVYEGSSKEVSNQFAVNLFDAVESTIRPNESISTTYEDVVAQAAWEPTRREGWRYLLVAALVLLVVEWYVYNRRVYL
jgi:hypothetical protein